MSNNKDITDFSKTDAVLEKVIAPKVEEDVLATLLSMSDEKKSNDEAIAIDVKRGGVVRFTFKINQLSDEDIRKSRKAATTTKSNPNGKKYPPIEWDRNETKYRSLVIYNATVPEDRNKIWGNASFMQQKNLVEPWESVDEILNVGEKMSIFEKVLDHSGLLDADDEPEEEYAKN
jgi:Phage XkdN-like protein.